jgi:glycosyltransferase involved in cell wall biosynthesis
LEHFAPLDDARPARRRFLMIARVVADKGIREYVEAARRIRRSWPDARFELMGPLDVPNRTAIGADEVRSWDAEGVIRYLPPAGDVRPAIAKADFVVLPSYREGLARVLLEAAAMARPIVTTDVPGCRHVVTEGVNGYLCAPRDAAALAEALERAARTEDADWHRMAASGRALVSERFSEQQVIDAYLEALSDTGIAPPGALPRKPSS